MDYEKKYNEALKRTRELSKTITGANYEYIFPELKEDEDERIRRVFRGWIYTQPVSFFDGISKEKMLAWLEKQGKNNTGISETTKQRLWDNLNNALEKETSESWNKFLDKQGEQKPVEWSEEDEEIAEALNVYAKNLDIFFSEIKIGDKDILSKEFREKVQHWLKTLKGRVQTQSKQEWSEEDERERKRIIGLLEGWLSTFKETYYAEECKYGINWLKSLHFV